MTPGAYGADSPPPAARCDGWACGNPLDLPPGSEWLLPPVRVILAMEDMAAPVVLWLCAGCVLFGDLADLGFPLRSRLRTARKVAGLPVTPGEGLALLDVRLMAEQGAG